MKFESELFFHDYPIESDAERRERAKRIQDELDGPPAWMKEMLKELPKKRLTRIYRR